MGWGVASAVHCGTETALVRTSARKHDATEVALLEKSRLDVRAQHGDSSRIDPHGTIRQKRIGTNGAWAATHAGVQQRLSGGGKRRATTTTVYWAMAHAERVQRWHRRLLHYGGQGSDKYPLLSNELRCRLR